ncbi:MAG TPA: cytochrome c3 family protein [Dissulfurispiraceae bacterium]|nr:cytochrome c3 family protein [Dissulfurispiraceae bacterium]
MKINIFSVLFALLLVLFAATVVVAGINPGTGIKGSIHDLSKNRSGGIYGIADPTLDRICIYCHAPHHTIKPSDALAQVSYGSGFGYVPLWNHDLTLVNSFTLYSNSADNEKPGDISKQLNENATAVGSVSKLCLSCHDGTIAVASFGNAGGIGLNYAYSGSRNTGSVFIQDVNKKNWIGAGAKGGTSADLSNHHPIGFDYYAVAAVDTQIADPSTAMGATGYSIQNLLWNAKYDSGGNQSGGTMECSTCHSVHNKGNLGEKFLWVSDQQSSLCLTCHMK